ncbi:MAG: hypothetical protein D4R68_08205 [Ignavibacteriales bacterium]|nr:MAG: hypothetical protein D4R68_08205 [Ignavibacteriales bacterium]
MIKTIKKIGLKMNWIMILGIIVIAIGTFLTYLGSNYQSNKVSDDIKEKIQDTNAKIAALQKEPSINKEAVDKLDNEFSSWATEFIKNKDSQKLHYEKEILDNKGKELSLNKEWVPFYNCFFETLKNLLNAYNKSSKNKIAYEIPQLPDNLFSERINEFVAEIKFSKNIVWKISLRLNRLDILPYIDINVENNSKDTGCLTIVALIRSRKNIRVLKNNQNIFITNNLMEEYDLDNYTNSLKTILKIIVEYQLALID